MLELSIIENEKYPYYNTNIHLIIYALVFSVAMPSRSIKLYVRTQMYIGQFTSISLQYLKMYISIHVNIVLKYIYYVV